MNEHLSATASAWRDQRSVLVARAEAGRAVLVALRRLTGRWLPEVP